MGNSLSPFGKGYLNDTYKKKNQKNSTFELVKMLVMRKNWLKEDTELQDKHTDHESSEEKKNNFSSVIVYMEKEYTQKQKKYIKWNKENYKELPDEL